MADSGKASLALPMMLSRIFFRLGQFAPPIVVSANRLIFNPEFRLTSTTFP